MALNTRGLGRGLDALFETTGANSPAADTPFRNIPVDALAPSPHQPREVFADDSLGELAQSIRQHGVLQPLLARPGAAADTWVLIAGERRLRAAKLAGLKEVPVIVRQLSDQEARIVTLLENLQRENLNPMEEARGLEKLREATQMTLEALAAALGRPRSSLSNSLRLLKLPEPIQEELAKGHISASHAKTLASFDDPEAALQLCQHIIDNGLTIRQTEDMASFRQAHGHFPWQEGEQPVKEAENGQKPRRLADPGLVRLAGEIGQSLNCRAKISGSQDKGRISLAYESNEQLFELLEKLGMSLNP